MNERFPLIAAQVKTPSQKAVNDEICAEARGSLIGSFGVLPHVPQPDRRIHKIGEYLRFECTLPKDVIELAVPFPAPPVCE